MTRKIFSASLVTGIVLIGAAFADEIDEQQREENPLFCQVEESDEEASLELLIEEESREEPLASCGGGKCPREMIERLRAQKRLEREEEEKQEEQLALNDSKEEEEEEQLALNDSKEEEEEEQLA